VGGSHPNRFERFTASTALSGSTFFKPPALPEVADWGSRRYQQKIFGKRDSDDMADSRKEQLHMEKQYVLLYLVS